MKGLSIIILLAWGTLLIQVRSDQSGWRPITVPRQMQRRHEFLDRLRKDNYVSNKNTVRHDAPNGYSQATTSRYKYGEGGALPGGGFFRYGGNGGSYTMKSGYSYSSGGGNLRVDATPGVGINSQRYASGTSPVGNNQVQLGYNGGTHGASINSPSLPTTQPQTNPQNYGGLQQNAFKAPIKYDGQGNLVNQRESNNNYATPAGNFANNNNYNQNLPNRDDIKIQHPVPTTRVPEQHPDNHAQYPNYDVPNHPEPSFRSNGNHRNNNNAQNNNAGNNLRNGGGIYEANGNFRGPVTPSGSNLNTGNKQNHNNNNNNDHQSFDNAAKAGEFRIGNTEPNSHAPNLLAPHRGGNGGPGSQLDVVTGVHYHDHQTHNPTITSGPNNVKSNIINLNRNTNNNFNSNNHHANLNNNNNQNTNLNVNYDVKLNNNNNIPPNSNTNIIYDAEFNNNNNNNNGPKSNSDNFVYGKQNDNNYNQNVNLNNNNNNNINNNINNNNNNNLNINYNNNINNHPIVVNLSNKNMANLQRNNNNEYNKEKNTNDNNNKNSANLLKSNDYSDDYDYNNFIDIPHITPFNAPPPPPHVDDPFPEPEPFLPSMPLPPQNSHDHPPLPNLPPTPPFILDHPPPTLPPSTVHPTMEMPPQVFPSNSPHGPPVNFPPLSPQNINEEEMLLPPPPPTNQPQFSSTPMHDPTQPPRPTLLTPSAPPSDDNNDYDQHQQDIDQNQPNNHQNQQNPHQNPLNHAQFNGPPSQPEQFLKPFDPPPHPPQQGLQHQNNLHQTNQNFGGGFYYPPAGPNVDFYHSHVQNSNSINDSSFQKLMKVIYNTLYYGDLDYKTRMKRDTSATHIHW